MASRRLALMGAREGPQVFIGAIKEPQLRVRGLKSGCVEAWIRIYHGELIQWMIYENGDHPFALVFGKPMWVQISASNPSSTLLCEVISKVA